LATSGYFLLATSGYFHMATDTQVHNPHNMALLDNTSTGGRSNPWVYCKESATEVAVHLSC
jgi:hypothetical protein